MPFSIKSRRRARLSRLLGAAAAICLLGGVPMVAGNFTPANAQVRGTQVSIEFRQALQPYGRWERHSRWGEVWVPGNRGRGWRPYTEGRWVYSNDWGWYWAEDQSEAAWGWIAYHYGRWIFDDDAGWAWVPGNQWGPAFVQWRYGENHIGWAPLPPDDVVIDYRDQPEVWTFCRARDFEAPLIAGFIIARNEYLAFFRDTVVVNQTVLLRERGQFAVNPGIPPALIAAASGRPLHTFDVRPRILAGTGQVPGAIVVGPQQLQAWRNGGGNRNFAQASLRETSQTIAPARGAQPLRPLAPGERGHLGANPPLAAQRTGAPLAQPLQQRDRRAQPEQREGVRQQPPTQGLGAARERDESRGVQNQQQGRREVQPAMRDQQSPQTQGRGSNQKLREEENRAAGGRPEGRASERSRQTDTERRPPERRAVEERRQQIDTERRAARPQQRPATEGRSQVAPERAQPRAGRSGLEPGRASVRPEPRPERRSAPSATEGRGGGFGAMSAPRAPVGGGGGAPHAAPTGGGVARAPVGGGAGAIGGGPGAHGHGR